MAETKGWTKIMAKAKKFTSASMAKVEDMRIKVRTLHEITGVPVSVSVRDWDFLRERGQLKMRVPYDETQAFLKDVPVRRHGE